MHTSPSGTNRAASHEDRTAALPDDLRAALARRLARAKDAAAGGTAGSAIPRAERTGPLPMSPGQQRIWFTEDLTPGVPITTWRWHCA
jgi:hypothetical protein